MGRLTLFGLLVTLAQSDPLPRPAKELDPKDAISLATHVLYNTRTQKSYETRFKGRIQLPKSTPLDYDGRSVWACPAVVFVHYTATGGDDRKIVRAGEEVWIYHSLLCFWTTEDDQPLRGAGRGMQNPDEILAVLGGHLGSVKLAAPGVAEIRVAGAPLAGILKDHFDLKGVLWKDSRATITLRADADFRLKSLECAATLQSANGPVQYDSRLEIVAYNAARELAFEDEQKRPIPLTKEIREGVEKATAVRK